MYYGSIPVRVDLVDCYKGRCRILSNAVYCPFDESICLPNDHIIELPKFHPQSKSKDIFRAMGSGIILEVFDGQVYVMPLCRAVVYYSHSALPRKVAKPISKDHLTKVFGYNKAFRPTLEQYTIMQDQPQPPSPYLILPCSGPDLGTDLGTES